jgi:hypothetical protein
MFKGFFSLGKVFPEVLDYRTFKIEDHSYDQLDVGYSSRPVPDCIIYSCKFSVCKIAFKRTVN